MRCHSPSAGAGPPHRPHRYCVTRLCCRVSSQRSSTSITPQVMDGHIPRESRPRLLFALVVVGRRVLPFFDHLVPLLEDGFQPRSLAKRRREGRGRHTAGSQQSGEALRWSLAQVPWHPHQPCPWGSPTYLPHGFAPPAKGCGAFGLFQPVLLLMLTGFSAHC